MTSATHNLIWHFDAKNVSGEVKTFQCSKQINPESWDTPWEAAMFLTLNQTIPALKEEAEKVGGKAWHVDKSQKMSSAIRVYDLRRLSDTAL